MSVDMKTLAAQLGIDSFPARWSEFFDEVMDKFDREGCPLTSPDYYDETSRLYGVPLKYIDAYKEAAQKMAENEPLSRFLALLCRALEDRDKINDDISELKYPKSPTGEYDIAYEMVSGMAICSMAKYTYDMLAARGVPEDMIRSIVRLHENGVRNYRERHDGRPGYGLLDWYQLSIDAQLFPIGRLEVDTKSKFYATVAVFQNADGEQVALADGITLHRSGRALGSKYCEDEEGSWTAEISESDEAWCGYPYDDRGLVKNEKVTLPKAEWKKILSGGDKVIGLHIPPVGPLTPELVDRTLAEIRDFFAKYYPDYDYKGFVCSSWLMDPQLDDMLGDNSNIAKFGRRFKKATSKSAGKGVFFFIFKIPGDEIDYNALPENTSLERKLKEHYLNGKVIYEMRGYFLK